MYQHVRRPNALEKDTILNVFIKGISPMWEDPAHTVGGAWTFRARRGHANQIWENLLLGLVGEQFELDNEVTGIRIVVQAQGDNRDIDKFEVWFRHGKDEDVKAQVRKDFLRIIELPSDTQLSFTSFTQYLTPAAHAHAPVEKAYAP
jgi:translation initiation factor 4E